MKLPDTYMDPQKHLKASSRYFQLLNDFHGLQRREKQRSGHVTLHVRIYRFWQRGPPLIALLFSLFTLSVVSTFSFFVTVDQSKGKPRIK